MQIGSAHRDDVRRTVEGHRAAQREEVRREEAAAGRRLTPAELALRYDALLIPVHGIRCPDGLRFRVHVGQPVEPGEPAAMMQALNDDLEMLVRRHMDQWFWVHRRWK